MAKIQLNGKKISIKSNFSLFELLQKYNLSNKKIAVEHNGKIVPKTSFKKKYLKDKPNNLVIRFSAPMVNQRAPESWPNSSEVVDSGATCPAAQQDNECRDCRQCWDPEVKTIKYGKH